MALTKDDFERMQCENPDCRHESHELVLHSNCHPRTPTWTAYRNGVLTVTCSLCHRVVAEIAVMA